jgi:hypothetical protein
MGVRGHETSGGTKRRYLGLMFVEYEPQREEQNAAADLQIQVKINRTVSRRCVHMHTHTKLYVSETASTHGILSHFHRSLLYFYTRALRRIHSYTVSFSYDHAS